MDTESGATLVHSFVASRDDYCNAFLARAESDDHQTATSVEHRSSCGQRYTHKFDRGLSRLLHTDLHWLDVSERVVYKLGVTALNCLHGQAPPYLVELCQSVADVALRQHLRSATRQLLVVPRYRLSTYGRRAFSVAGPSVWNSLPESLLDPVIDGNF